MEKEKMIDTVMAYSPIERQIDMCGCEIGVSRQWYEETNSILMDINNGVYRKVTEGAVVLTKEELAKHDEKVRKEAREEILDDIFGPWNEIGDGIYELTSKDKKMLYKKYGVEVEE